MWLPTKRDIDFTIELVPGAAPMSKTPYRMSTPEDARTEDATTGVVGEEVYQAECVSLGSTSSVCKEERWYTQVVY